MMTYVFWHCVAATVAPDFTQKPRNATAPIGGDAKFEAVVSGEPDPEVKW